MAPRGKHSMRRPKGARQQRELPVTALSYRGPARIRAPVGDTVITRPMMGVYLVSSGNNGVISYNVYNTPSLFQEWSTLAQLYTEYRALALSVQWVPFYEKWGSTTALSQNQAPIIVYPWRNSTQALPSGYSATFGIEGSKVHSIQDKFTYTIKMDGAAEAEFDNISQVNPTFSIGIYADGLSGSIAYGYVFATVLVQFRARV